jgi:hypothetical protein
MKKEFESSVNIHVYTLVEIKENRRNLIIKIYIYYLSDVRVNGPYISLKFE